MAVHEHGESCLPLCWKQGAAPSPPKVDSSSHLQTWKLLDHSFDWSELPLSASFELVPSYYPSEVD